MFSFAEVIGDEFVVRLVWLRFMASDVCILLFQEPYLITKLESAENTWKELSVLTDLWFNSILICLVEVLVSINFLAWL